MHNGDVDGGQSALVRRRWMMDPHTPEQACTTYHPETRESSGSHCVPESQLGLATTPKLTGGHDVARGPERIDGFALRPAWTSQLKSVVTDADGEGCCHGRGPAGG
jgi:hypothetical protein